MKIILKETFLRRLERQVEYIAKDSPDRARQFKNEVLVRIRNIVTNPYQYRKSFFFNDILIRDMVFKGYVIVFRITPHTIEVFGFVNYENSVTD